METRRYWCIWLIFCLYWQFAGADDRRAEILIDFRVNVTHIEPEYAGNALRLQAIHSLLRGIAADSAVRISSVTFCGYASPEGSDELNRHLAAGRLASLENLVREDVEIPDSIISRVDSYIPWEYLRRRVEESGIALSDSVIDIIDMPARLVVEPGGDNLVDHRIVRLKSLQHGKVWDELFRRYFSGMRNASAVIFTFDEVAYPLVMQEMSPASLDVAAKVDDMAYISAAAIPASRKPRHLFMALRTNMLYDALAVPNVGAEFYLGRNFSISAGWMHAWWSSDARRRYWRLYGGEIGIRRWFGKAARSKPLTGHHIGLYAQALTYDFQFGGKAYIGGEPGGSILDRAHFGGGIEYGYSLPVHRRLNIDFSIGAGYLGGRVYEFVPGDEGYSLSAIKNRNWIGPTKLEVSLVWLLGKENVNLRHSGKRKGGGL